MSYGHPGNLPPYGQYPPQQGYGQPPMQNQPYPPQHGFPQQQAPAYNQGPQQGQYGAQGQLQSQGGYYQQPQQQYNQPPAQGASASYYGSQQAQPQGPYGQPPQTHYSAQGQHPPQGQYPPQGTYPSQSQYPPQNQFGGLQPASGIPTPPSPGYAPGVFPNVDMSKPADQLRVAMKGFGTDDKTLIRILAEVPDAPLMLKLRQTYDERHRRSLLKDLKSETSGYYEEALLALARGPLDEDVYLLDKAIAGIGTKEAMLNDVVLGRSNADLNAIKQAYHRTYHKDLAKEVHEDLSMKTQMLFDYVMQARRAEESAPCLPHEIETAVDRLQQATEGTKFGANQEAVCQIIAFSSDGQLRAINNRYAQKYGKQFDEVLKKEFSGHMAAALRLMLGRAVDRVKTDAEQLDETMKGAGTKDELLVSRMVRAHWNREHMRQVGVAYKRFFGRELRERVRSETSGRYKDLMMALCV